MTMVENLRIEVECISEDCYSIHIFGVIMRVVRDYEEVNEFIEEFCEEWNIDTYSLIVDEY